MKREKVDKRYVIRLTESEAEVLEKTLCVVGNVLCQCISSSAGREWNLSRTRP